MAGAPALEIVIVAYRSRDLLEACLTSLRAHGPRAGHQTFVVDNASGDGTADMVRQRFPEVDLAVLATNSGFSYANNVALRNTNAPFVLLLNPDTEVTPGALDHMIDTLRRRTDVGMAGCRLVRPDGTFDHAAKRSFPTPVSALGHFTGLGRRNGSGSRLSQYRATALGELDIGEVDAVNGAFMLVRREALEEVGLLDEGYWLYMEDLDWCYAFREAGWKVLYDGRVSVTHVKSGTAGRHRRLRQNVAFHRGMGRYYRKWHAGTSPVTDAAVYAGIGAKLLLSTTRSALLRRVEARRRR